MLFTQKTVLGIFNSNHIDGINEENRDSIFSITHTIGYSMKLIFSNKILLHIGVIKNSSRLLVFNGCLSIIVKYCLIS